MAKKTASKVSGKKYIYRKPNVKFDFNIGELPWTQKQQKLIQLLQQGNTQKINTRCVLIRGCAGTAKTIITVYAGLQLLKQGKISDITYVRSAVESGSAKIGFLPGDITEKFAVYETPLIDKLDELLEGGIVKALKDNNHIQALPINYMRGLNFSGRLVIMDEAQNFTYDELVTAITRMGEYSKLWIIGDPKQSDLKNGNKEDFINFCDKLSDSDCENNGIHSFEFGVEDILRSKFCKFVVEKLQMYENLEPKKITSNWTPNTKLIN